jgi:hypothetical protein
VGGVGICCWLGWEVTGFLYNSLGVVEGIDGMGTLGNIVALDVLDFSLLVSTNDANDAVKVYFSEVFTPAFLTSSSLSV